MSTEGPSGPSKLEIKLVNAMQEKKFYEAHQLLKTIYFRYVIIISRKLLVSLFNSWFKCCHNSELIRDGINYYCRHLNSGKLDELEKLLVKYARELLINNQVSI